MRAILFIMLVGGCSSKDAKDEYVKRSKALDAEVNLRTLEKAMKAHLLETSQFPPGTAPLTPATPCCAGANRKCPADYAQWGGNPVWDALSFSVEHPGYFQYGYESDGKTARVTAVGDLDCDSVTITYAVTCELVQGNAICTHIAPANAD